MYQRFQKSCAHFCAHLGFCRNSASHVSLSKAVKKALKSCDFKAFSWSEWNYRVSRNYEQQKWYSGSRQSVFLSEISYYAKRNSSLSKLGISFLFDKLNSATAAFKAFPKGWLAIAILLF